MAVRGVVVRGSRADPRSGVLGVEPVEESRADGGQAEVDRPLVISHFATFD